MPGRKPKTLEESYLSKVVMRGIDECWDWSAFKFRGYGRIHYNGTTVSAHRASYIIHNGPIPNGMVVCHRCDNPSCSNPRHLFLGTVQDNNRDRDRKGRAAVGERAPTARLTEDAVRDIRQNVTSRRGSNIAAFARKYGVTRRTAGAAYHGESWGHVK